MEKGLMENNSYEDNLNLFDCYRVALDFGLPVAEKAIDNLLVTLPEYQARESNN